MNERLTDEQKSLIVLIDQKNPKLTHVQIAQKFEQMTKRKIAKATVGLALRAAGRHRLTSVKTPGRVLFEYQFPKNNEDET